MKNELDEMRKERDAWIYNAKELQKQVNQLEASIDKSKHPALVKALAKPGSEILEQMCAKDAHLLHMTIGICGEAGELLDAVKKSTIYQKELDRVNVIEELGDLEFYMEGLRQGLNLSREECLAHNIAKLTKRYGEKYSNEAAQARADKQ